MLLSPCSISTATWSSDHMLCTCIYNIFVTDHVTWGSQEFGLWVFCLVIAERDIPTCTISYIYQHKIMTDIQNHTKLIQIDGIRIISRFLDKVESFDCCMTEVDMQEINRRWIQNTSAYCWSLQQLIFFGTSPCFAFHRRILLMHEVWTVLYHSLECILSVNLGEDSAMTKYYTKFVSAITDTSLHHFPNTNIDYIHFFNYGPYYPVKS